MDEKSPVALEESQETVSADDPIELADQPTAPIQDDTGRDGSESKPPSDDSIDGKFAAAEAQAKDYYDRLLRVSADFENYRKRSAREMKDIVKYANEELLRELLNVVDNLERAIGAAEKENRPEDPLLKGVTLTLTEIRRILERQNVKPLEALGKPFDPNFHQAMMQEESVDHPPNTVIRELQKGYSIHERLLRPAMVTVAKNGGS